MVAFACNDCGNLMNGFALTCSRCGRGNLSISSAPVNDQLGSDGGKSLSEMLTDKSRNDEMQKRASQTNKSSQSQPSWGQSSDSQSSWGVSSGSQSSWGSQDKPEPSWGESLQGNWGQRQSESSKEKSSDRQKEQPKAKTQNWSPKEPEAIHTKPYPGGASEKEKPSEKPAGIFTLFFGFLVPTAAIVFETQTHFCALSFFDPFPSLTHILFFALIPLTSLMAWLAGRSKLNMPAHAGVLSLFSGMAMGVAILYSLMFLPMAPLSILAIFLLGLGFLGLSPMLSMPCIMKSGRVACSIAQTEKTYADPHQLKHLGHMIILVMVIALELPSTLTRINLAEAASSNTESSLAGIKWLRSFGSEEVLLRACYERSGRATDILGSLYEFSHPVGVQTARDVFYKVTGKPFNTVPIPASARATIQHAGIMDDPADLNAGVEDEFDYDADIAGEIVSGVARGLSISTSKISGEIDPDAALANLTWAFTLSNTSKFDREARAKILLPPNAVVNRATLTVNGVERDAVIMGRSEARAVYQRSVVQKKDPLLVSMCGPDLVLVQCFPVRPSDKMLVKLSIVAPLTMSKADKASLIMPSFDERNFQIDVHHDIDLSSKTKLADAPLKSLTVATQALSEHITGGVDTAELARGEATLNFSRNPEVTVAWADRKSVAPANGAVEVVRPHSWAVESAEVQLRPDHYIAPTALTLLVDGSTGMAPFLPSVLKGLEALPKTIKTDMILVKDAATAIPDVKALSEVRCEGGQDNSTSLSNALMARDGNGAVLWIHAAQPITKKSQKSLVNRILQSSQSPVLLYDMQVVSSANEILDGVNNRSTLVRVHHTGSPEADLRSLFASWESPSASVPTSDKQLKVSTYSSLCDLEAYRQVRDMLARNNAFDAARTAQQQHIITSVTSAVVNMDLPATNPAPAAKAPTSGRKSYAEGWHGLTNIVSLGKSSSRGSDGMFSSARERDYAQKGGTYEAVPASRPLEESKSESRYRSQTYGNIGPQSGSAAVVSAPTAASKDGFASDKSDVDFNAPRQNIASNEFASQGDENVAAGDDTLVAGGGPNTGADTGTAASAPESDTWLLLAVVVALMSVALYLKKRGVAVRA